jgi:hypothetical protein
MLKRHARDPVADVSEVRELAHYFPDDSGDSGGDKGEEINPVGKIEIRAQPHRRRPVVIKADVEGDEGGSGGTDEGGGGGNGGEGTGEGEGTGGHGNRASQVVELTNVRSIVLSDRRRRVALTPGFSRKMELVLYEAGADTDRRLNVAKSSDGKIKSGAIRGLTAKKGVRLSVEVELDASFPGAMKVVGYAL